MAGETTSQNTSGAPLFTPHGKHVAATHTTFEITTGELEAADVIQTVELPVGAIILDGYLSTDDLDADGSPALTLKVGTGSDDDGYLAANTVGQAGGIARFDGALLRSGTALTADDTIDVKVGTAAATAAAGTVTLMVLYYTND